MFTKKSQLTNADYYQIEEARVYISENISEKIHDYIMFFQAFDPVAEKAIKPALKMFSVVMEKGLTYDIRVKVKVLHFGSYNTTVRIDFLFKEKSETSDLLYDVASYTNVLAIPYIN